MKIAVKEGIFFCGTGRKYETCRNGEKNKFTSKFQNSIYTYLINLKTTGLLYSLSVKYIKRIEIQEYSLKMVFI